MAEEKWTEVNSSTDEMWDKDKDKEFIGVYKSKKTEVGKNKSNVYAFDVDGKSVGVWGSTVIDTKMAEIMIGSKVKIEYLGITTSKNGNEYQDFKVSYQPTPFEEVFGKAEEQ